MQKIFIAGCGYIGERIAGSCRDSGAEIICLVRSSEHGARLAAAGYKVVVSALDDAASLPQLDVAATTMFYLVPPPGGGVVDTRVRTFIDTVLSRTVPAKIIYMSATSVYSETGGGVVTEESPTIPASAMGKRRLDAESAFMEYGRKCNVPVVVLRVSGIYGPGRLPLMQISQGQPLLREDESGPSNRIHADDLAAVCLAAGQYGEQGDIYNVSDGNPSSMTAYFNACADVFNLPRQQQVTMTEAARVMSPLMFSYVSESRIVDSSRMLKRLKVVLRYPSILEGLQVSVV